MTTTETTETKFSPTVEELTAKLIKFSGGGQINDFDEDRGTWKLREPIPAEGPVFLFIRVLDVSDAELAHGHKWGAEVVAVSPFMATDASICDALYSSGDWMAERWSESDSGARIDMLCEALIEYGVAATLVSKTSTRAIGPFRDCFRKLSRMSMFFGLYADQQMNALGNTGWDFIKGTYGYKKKEPSRKPSDFQKKVLRWLNDHYKARREFQASY